MSALAGWLARRLWWAMLWFMRRPLMKHLQRRSTYLFGAERQPQAYRSFCRQNAFARRYGLRLLTFSLTIMIASIIISVAFSLLTQLSETGALHVPESTP